MQLKKQMSFAHFLNSLRDEGGEYASRKVRAKCGPPHLRDNENNLNFPPHCTVHKLYEIWVFECGYIADSKGGGSSYGKIHIYQLRPNDQFWSEGSEATQVVSKGHI